MKKILCLVLALVMILSTVPFAAAVDEASEAAETLYALGLFKGTGTNKDGTPIFDLQKTPTRNQAVIMLVRLLGKEEEALAGDWELPFTDVAEGSTSYYYIGYAYANGLTNGTSATTYSGSNPIRANQYITFVLRALGYVSGEDFKVSTAWEFSDEIGLTHGEYNAENAANFIRGDVAKISANALDVKLKGEEKLLCVKIMASKSGSAANYDPVLNNWPTILEMGQPRLSLAEIQKMVELELELEEVAEIIDTLADLVQYLHQKGYTTDSGDLHFNYNGYEWSVNRSARTVFKNNKGNCGGGSNLVNYILSGDFDSQGYVAESANQGGHVYNYFEEDGTYYFFDLTQVVGGNYRKGHKVFATKDPQEFSDWYIGENHRTEKSNSNMYLLFQYMYEYEGDHLPKGSGNEWTPLNRPYSNVLPEEYKDVTTVLFVEDGMSGARFVRSPAKNIWPALA